MDFKKQAFINSIGSVILMFAQWLISVLLVRMGGYDDAGVFSLAMSISNVFSFFANYGIRNYQITDVSRRFSSRQYLAARILTSAISILACVGYLAVAKGYTQQERLAILLYLIYSNINVISDILLGSIQLQNHLEINGYSNVLRGAICFVAYFSTYFISHNLVLALLLMAFSALFVTAIYDFRLWIFYVAKEIPIITTKEAVNEILHSCFALMLSQILPIIITAVPRRSIQKILGTELLGYFSSIFTPTVLITTLAPAIILGFVPQIAQYWAKSQEKEFKGIVRQCYVGILFLTLSAEIAAFLLGKIVMKMIFGEEILTYFPLLYWAILATGINTVTMCGNSVLTAMKKTTSIASISVMATILVFWISDQFIYQTGIYGAAYVLVIGYSFQSIAQFVTMFFSSICKFKR